MKKLYKLEEIKAALATGQPVWCNLAGDIQSVSKGRIVRDVRRKHGSLQVQLLEGWREPVEVWINEGSESK